MNKSVERLKRQIATGLSVVSIVLCALTAILWPLSYATGVQLSVRNGAGTRYAIITVPGSIGWAVVRGEARALPSLDGGAKAFGSDAAPLSSGKDKIRWFWQKPPHSTFGFGSDSGSETVYFGEVNDSFKCTYSANFMPIWLLTILTFIGPILWYQARRRRQYRMENDLCLYCGADMSASPYRCPKCGKEQPW
jgi:hypothetical protein